MYKYTSDNITFLNTYSRSRTFLRLSEYVKIKQVIIVYNNERNTSKSCYYLLSFACYTACSYSVRLRPLLRPMVCPRPRSLSTFGSSPTLRFAPRPLPRLWPRTGSVLVPERPHPWRLPCWPPVGDAAAAAYVDAAVSVSRAVVGFGPAGRGHKTSLASSRQKSWMLSQRYHWRCSDSPGDGQAARKFWGT